MPRTCYLFPLMLFLSFVLAQEPAPTAPVPVTLRALPTFFVANHDNHAQGKRLVEDDSVVALVQTPLGRMSFTPGGAFLGFRSHSAEIEQAWITEPSHGKRSDTGMPPTSCVFKLGFAERNRTQRPLVPRLSEPGAATVSYLIGNPENWRTALPTYHKLIYDQVWDGISLEFLAFSDRLSCRWVLSPHADLELLAMESGAERLQLEAGGSLTLAFPGGELALQPARAYQSVAGRKVEVPSSFVPLEDGRFSLSCESYDHELPLVVEADLNWSTFLGGGGGSGPDVARAVALDGNGNSYLTGSTYATNFPVVAGAVQAQQAGDADLFVAKFDATASTLLYATFLGGSAYDEGFSLLVDDSGNALVGGFSTSSDFPTTQGAFDTSFGGVTDALLLKLNSTGSALVFSTFVGGSASDEARALVRDDQGNLYIAGVTYSSNFPTTAGAFDQSWNGGGDLFACKFDSNGTTLLYASFIGGSGFEEARAIALDSSRNLYLTGSVFSTNFPTTAGAFRETHSGSLDAYVVKLHAAGSSLTYSTFIGGSLDDIATGIAIDGSGNAYLTGYTTSSNFPTTAGVLDPSQNTGFSTRDGFVSKLNISGSVLAYSTYLGGQASDQCYAIAVNSSGQAFVVGETKSNDFPVTSGAYDTSFNGTVNLDSDQFVVKLHANATQLLYGTFLGGNANDVAYALALESNGSLTLAGSTASNNFPTSAGAFDAHYNGNTDVSLAKLNASGSSLLFSTFLGGSAEEYGLAIAVDGSGNTYVTGTVSSTTFPTTVGAYDTSWNGDESDLFVSKLDESGANLSYSTFIGGSGRDYGNAIALDALGRASLTGFTSSSDFPTTPGALASSLNGSSDLFILRLNQSGTALDFSTYLGGSSGDEGFDIKLDGSSNSYVTGYTLSADFPATQDAFSVNYGGNRDAFVAKLDATGATLGYATFLGGFSSDYGNALAVNSSGNAFVTGNTSSSDFPTTEGAFSQDYSFVEDSYIVKLSADGSSLSYSTYLGGSHNDYGRAIALDASGDAIVSGETYSRNFPTTPGAFQQTPGSNANGFVSKLNASGSALVFSSFLSGSAEDFIRGMSVASDGSIKLAGYTKSSDFPITQDAYDSSQNGQEDAFYAEMTSDGSSLNYATFLGGSENDYCIDLALGPSGHAYLVGSTYSPDFPVTQGAYQSGMEGRSDLFVAHLELCTSPLLVAQPNPTSVCVGEEAYLEVEASGAGLSYQWYKDGDPLMGETQASLTLAQTTEADEGQYHCEVTGACRVLDTEPVEVSVGLRARVQPGVQGLGLRPPRFDIAIICADPQVQVSWSAHPPTALTSDGTAVELDPPPSVQTRLFATVTDGTRRGSATYEGLLLVAAGYQDYNGDGCSNLVDLWELMAFWKQSYNGDPNGDGQIDILDALYLGFPDPVPCP